MDVIVTETADTVLESITAVTIVDSVEQDTDIISVGTQGPAGAQGAQGAQGLIGSNESYSVLASEDLAAGDLVNIWVDGVSKVRKATRDNYSKPAHGFVLIGYVTGGAAVVYLNGVNTAVTGQTPGVVYLGLSGATVATPPVGTGVVQAVGVAVSATVVMFRPGTPIVLAGTAG